MYREKIAEGTEYKLGARRHAGALLDLNPATLRNWIRDDNATNGTGPAGGSAGRRVGSPRRSER